MKTRTSLPIASAIAAALLLSTAASAATVPTRDAAPTSSTLTTGDRSGGSGVPSYCRGELATVVQPGEEYTGTEGRDVLVVRSPGALVWGQYGDDLICVYGDPTSEYHGSEIHGGPGNDNIIIYSGSHTVTGEGDQDVIVANGHAQEIEGGEGNDVINAGGADSAWIYGGGGNDLISGSPGNDTMFGNAGNDFLLGWDGNDTLWGDEGNDSLYGGMGWDGLGGGLHIDNCHDYASALNGGMYGDCESVTETPAAADGLAG